VRSDLAREGLLLYGQLRDLESDRQVQFSSVYILAFHPMSFPPPKLPNIEVLLAIPSYDAPVLHDDLQLRLQIETSSPKKSQGKGILCLESSID
jgi:hypothetical protein